ncbi:hypothetical protein BD413DRAFT_592724, partial [Trametes elegans]
MKRATCAFPAVMFVLETAVHRCVCSNLVGTHIPAGPPVIDSRRAPATPCRSKL